jgi:hypothetical protein
MNNQLKEILVTARQKPLTITGLDKVETTPVAPEGAGL